MLNNSEVLGVVVSYNPDNNFKRNVNQLLEHVQSIVIIDNGSKKNLK